MSTWVPDRRLRSSATAAIRPARNDHATRRGSGGSAIERISAVLGEFRRARIRPMSRDEANRVTRMLGEMQSMVTSLMYDAARQVAEADPDTDPGQVLRRGARLPGRESKRMARIAKQLSDMPRSRNGSPPARSPRPCQRSDPPGGEGRCRSRGRRPDLAGSGRRNAPGFVRPVRPEVVGTKADRTGPRPAGASAASPRGQDVGEKDTGLGILMAKLPRPQFEQVRQAVDNHYRHHLRRDGADG